MWLSACSSNIDITVPETDDTYIVEGWIEQGGFAKVMVSHSLPYNTSAGLADLFNLLISEARVTLKCGAESERLQLVQDTMYAVIPIYRGFIIKGETGKAYTVEVNIGDHLFTCTDTLKVPAGPDSLWFIPEPTNDSLGYIHIRLHDPPTPGNFYRIFAKRLGLDLDYSGMSGSLLDDRMFNGTTINFPLIRTGPETDTGDKHFFRRGQRVVVKTAVITSQYFNFLSKVSNEIGPTLSPLSFQVPAPSLMTGGALGGWGCYAVQYDTIDIR